MPILSPPLQKRDNDNEPAHTAEMFVIPCVTCLRVSWLHVAHKMTDAFLCQPDSLTSIDFNAHTLRGQEEGRSTFPPPLVTSDWSKQREQTSAPSSLVVAWHWFVIDSRYKERNWLQMRKSAPLYVRLSGGSRCSGVKGASEEDAIGAKSWGRSG